MTGPDPSADDEDTQSYEALFDTLLERVRTRRRVDVAVGIVMENTGLGEHGAFQYLLDLAREGNVTLIEYANDLVDKTSEQNLPENPGPDLDGG